MNDIEKMILSDAIRSSIEADAKCIRMTRLCLILGSLSLTEAILIALLLI